MFCIFVWFIEQGYDVIVFCVSSLFLYQRLKVELILMKYENVLSLEGL